MTRSLACLFWCFLLQPTTAGAGAGVCTRSSSSTPAQYWIERAWKNLFFRNHSGGTSSDVLIPQLEGLDSSARFELLVQLDDVWLKMRAKPDILKFVLTPDPLFILNPGEPERLAVTGDLIDDPIYFNLPLITKQRLGYSQLIQLLLHELGHKWMAKRKIPKPQRAADQARIDAAAAAYAKLFSPRESQFSFGPILRLAYANPIPMSAEFQIGAKQGEVLPMFAVASGTSWVDLMPQIEQKLRVVEASSIYYRRPLIIANLEILYSGFREVDGVSFLHIKLWLESGKQEKGLPFVYNRPRFDELIVTINLPAVANSECATVSSIELFEQRPELLADLFRAGIDATRREMNVEIGFTLWNDPEILDVRALVIRMDGRLLSIPVDDPRISVEWPGTNCGEFTNCLRLRYNYGLLPFAWKKEVLGVVVRAGPGSVEHFIPNLKLNE